MAWRDYPWSSGRSCRTYPNNGLTGRYSKIDIPVTVCWGQDDTWIPPARGRDLASRIPYASFLAIPHAGQLVQEDNPAELTAAILAFLQGKKATKVAYSVDAVSGDDRANDQ